MRKLFVFLFCVIVVCVGIVLAADLWNIKGIDGTSYGKLDSSGNFTVKGTATIKTISVATMTVSGIYGLKITAGGVETSTPTALGILILNSKYDLYVSTELTVNGWKKLNP